MIEKFKACYNDIEVIPYRDTLASNNMEES